MKLSDDERSELDSLRARYPDLPEDPDDPMKRSSDAIKAALKRFGNDNRPSSSQGPNEQAPARGGGPPGSSQPALPRSTVQPAEAEPSTTVPLEKRQSQNAAPMVDGQDHTTK
jgi:hypothetical protein